MRMTASQIESCGHSECGGLCGGFSFRPPPTKRPFPFFFFFFFFSPLTCGGLKTPLCRLTSAPATHSLPPPPRLVAEHVRDQGARAAALTYGITLTVTAVMFQAIWLYASLGRRLLRADADERLVRGITRSYLPGPFIYLAATLIALVSPTASVVLFGAIALFYVAESSLFGGARGRGARSG